MKKCPICGKENNDNIKKCINCGAALDSASTLELAPGKMIGNKYRIGKVIGKGGFGITYKGSDLILKRVVAIKEFFQMGSSRTGDTVIPPQTITKKMYEESKQKFLNEATVLARVKNENIVNIHEYISENNTGYIVMEYVAGRSLRSELESKGKISETETRELILQLIKGLKEVHRQNLLHRDIKPENIMIENEIVKLLDFGAAREYALGKSMDMSRILTPGYAPIEQYSGRSAFGPELDIYAIGATMYEMIVGEKPPTPIERMKSTETLEKLELEDIEKNFKEAIEKCMKIQHPERYSSLDELEKVLQTNNSEDKTSLPVKANNLLIEKKAKPVPGLQIVKKGKFVMGDEYSKNKSNWRDIQFSYNFKVGNYPVTFKEYDLFCSETGKSIPNDGGFGRDFLPVINVSWIDAINYCNWLSERKGINRAYNYNYELIDRNGKKTEDVSNVRGYRLLTEAEWEYVSRGGTRSKKYRFSGGDHLHELAWFKDNSASSSHEVGLKKENELGIYDMTGNVSEWCYDSYKKDLLTSSITKQSPFISFFLKLFRKKGSSIINPICLEKSNVKVIRGGNYMSDENECFLSNRFSKDMNTESKTVGFRICKTDFFAVY